MKTAPYLTALAIALSLLVGCTKDDDLSVEQSLDECLAPFLDELDMAPYVEGDRIGSAFYLEAYRAGGQLSFSLGSYVADVEFNLIACGGADVCAEQGDRACGRIVREAEYLGIVAVGR